MGVAIALFNQVSRIAIFPLVSVTTSFVAEEDTMTGGSQDFKDIINLEDASSEDSENKMLIPQNRMLNLILDIIFTLWFSVNMVYNFYKTTIVLGLDEKKHNLEPAIEIGKTEPGKKQIATASSALIIGGVLGIIEAAFLISAARPLLSFMGVKHVRKTRLMIYHPTHTFVSCSNIRLCL